VTSRDELRDLVAVADAKVVRAGLLRDDAAVRVLSGRIGADRVAAEPEATGLIVVRCAGLPLALVVAAANAVCRPDLPLSALAASLADAGAPSDVLDGASAASRVRAVLSWSYRTLSPDAARTLPAELAQRT
jgi:hypothetical protein